jgi:hypothetical protein
MERRRHSPSTDTSPIQKEPDAQPRDDVLTRGKLSTLLRNWSTFSAPMAEVTSSAIAASDIEPAKPRNTSASLRLSADVFGIETSIQERRTHV